MYEGDYVRGKRTGDGIFTFANGDRYTGHFTEGDKDGHGVLCWKMVMSIMVIGKLINRTGKENSQKEW